MKFNYLILLLLILLQIPTPGFSQKQKMKWASSDGTVRLISGDPDKLTDAKSFSAIFNAATLKLGMNQEADTVYIKKKVQELNKKKSGKGDDFQKEWENTRTYFLPEFIDGYNTQATKFLLPLIDTVKNGISGPKYAMVLHPDLLYYNQGTPMLYMRLDIFSSQDRKDTIAEFSFEALGTNSTKHHYPNYNPAAFNKAGDILGKLFEKYIFKTR